MDKFSGLKAIAEKAKELGGINNYKKGKDAGAAFQAAATPTAILALLAELEAKDREIDAANARVDAMCAKAMNLTERAESAEKKLATPVRLMGEMLLHDWEHSVERQAAFQHRKTAWDARLEEDKKAIRAAGFTVEGDE